MFETLHINYEIVSKPNGKINDFVVVAAVVVEKMIDVVKK